MGIQTDDGHEGFVAFEFADGMTGGTWSAGPIATTRPDGTMLPGSEWQARADAEVIGWRPICHDLNHHGARECWRGELWTRVTVLADQDLSQRLIYSETADLDEADKDLILRREWEVHVAPTRGTADVRYAADEADAAQSRLAAAVRSAREQGASWEAIGKAARMTRQSAHERWARVI
ncbi:hypothetical protein [Streptomyces sp. NPDC058664]|uniref:hypothetical protein n=1 Tax=Streptomyces sp. NPDC058664 TaxID=3346585 RepID=UPI00365E6A55